MSGTVSLGNETAPYQLGEQTFANQQKQNNPLGQLGQFADISRTLAEATRIGMEVRANQQMAGVMQQSMGPDGQVDPTKLFVNAASNPATAYKALDIWQQGLVGGKIKADTALEQLGAARARTENMTRAAASLLPLGPSISSTDVATKLQQLIANGDVTSQEAVNYMASLPSNGPGIHQALKSFTLQGMNSGQALDQVYGTISQLNVGGQVVPNQSSPFMGYSGPPGQGTTYNTTLTPGEKTGLVQVYNPATRQMELKPRYIAAAQGGAQVPGGAAPGGGAPTAAPAPEAQQEMTSGFQQITADANVAAQAQPILGNMLNVLQSGQRFGGGQQFRLELAQKAQAVGAPQSVVDKLAGGDLGTAQTFLKNQLLNAARTMTGSGVGQITNEKFKAFQDAILHENLDPRALLEIGKQLQSMNQVALTKQQAYNFAKAKGADPAEFESKWNKDILPNLPAYRSIENPQIKALLESRNKAAAKQEGQQ